MEVGARRVAEHDDAILLSSVAEFVFVGLVFAFWFPVDAVAVGISIAVTIFRSTSRVSLGILVVAIATAPRGSWGI